VIDLAPDNLLGLIISYLQSTEKVFFACVLLVTLATTIGCDRTPGVRSSQGGGGANTPATERSPEPSPSVTP
jgi:hypothetical protein